MRFLVWVTFLLSSGCSLFEPAICEVHEDCRDFEFCAENRRCSDGIRIDEGCTEECASSGDGECDDGGANALTGFCQFGSDCSDCGRRTVGEQDAFLCVDNCFDFTDEGQDIGGNGTCDDGGPGAAFSLCDYGSDCIDCGRRPPIINDVYLYGTLDEAQEVGVNVVSLLSNAQDDVRPLGGFPALPLSERPKLGHDGRFYYNFAGLVYQYVDDNVSYSLNGFSYPALPQNNDESWTGFYCENRIYSYVVGTGGFDIIEACDGQVFDELAEDISQSCARPFRLSLDHRLACKNDNDLVLRSGPGEVFVEVGPDLGSVHAARFHDGGMWVVGRLGEEIVLDHYSQTNVRLSRVVLAEPPEPTQWVGSAIGPNGNVYAMSFSGDYVYKFEGQQVSTVFDQSRSVRIHALKLIY